MMRRIFPFSSRATSTAPSSTIDAQPCAKSSRLSRLLRQTDARLRRKRSGPAASNVSAESRGARIRQTVARFRNDQRGVAAIEFAILAGFLSVSTLNVADISIYVHERMEVENATQMGAQSAWKACDASHLPATRNCPGLDAAVSGAIQSTSLGSGVTLVSGSPSEGYYCMNASNALQLVSDVLDMPTDCTSAGMPGLLPADYIKVQTTFTFSPLFSSISIASMFPTVITKTAIMRMG